MIDQDTVEKIIQAARIEDVVSDFVTLRKRGVSLVGLCPFHNERTPSFAVSPAKNLFKCFGCGKGGSPVTFIMEHEHLNYGEALRYLAAKYGIEIVEKELTEEEKERRSSRESCFALNDFALKYFEHNLWETDEGQSVGLRYFRDRGFTDAVIKKFRLGYSLASKDSLAVHALKSGYPRKLLLQTGLCSETREGGLIDRFRGRVMFPVHTISGKVVAFGGRVLQTADNTAKYLNSPESEIYHKSNELYGVFLAKQSMVKNDRCYLVEGYTDVMSMHQSGIENVVASSGTSLTEGQIKQIHRFTPNIVVLYDGDSAGIKASIRGIDMLLREGMNVKTVLLPDGEDPDSFAKGRDSSEFARYLNEKETDFIHFKSRLLLSEAGGDPVKKAGLISGIVESIAQIPDVIVRQMYIKDCSLLFEMRESVLTAEVAKKIAASRAAEKKKAAGAQAAPSPATATAAAEQDLPPMALRPFAYKEERNLITFLIEKCNETMTLATEDGGEESISMRDYIMGSLEADGFEFEFPLHRRIAQEAMNRPATLKQDLLNNPDPGLQKYAFELCDNNTAFPEGELSAAALAYYAERSVLEFKSKMLEQRSKQMPGLIRAAKGDDAKIAELLSEQAQLKELRSKLKIYMAEMVRPGWNNNP